jgi:hypothetical protein
VRPPGCPIRIPWDLRLPAPPPGISPRGRVLPRPPSPRHPPCARLPDVSLVHCSIICSIQARPFGLAFQTGSRQQRTYPSLSAPAGSPPSRSLPGSRRPCSNRTIDMLLIQCAWMNRHDQEWSCLIHGRKTQQVSRGALSRCKSWAQKTERTMRTTYSSRRFHPKRWARLDSNQGPRPYQGRALTT